jgi:hypothetical protein
MANTKGKIIIAGGIIVVAGITTAILVSHYRKKRILNEIYKAINDTKTEQGQQALLNEENQLLASKAFDPNFWKKTSGDKPNLNLLMPSKMARDIARNIDDKMRGYVIKEDDEVGIISEFKKLKSKGQVSQVAYAYSNTPLSFGDLAQDITDALTGWFDSPTYITQLTSYINNLPN